jgi:hypothetical protein
MGGRRNTLMFAGMSSPSIRRINGGHGLFVLLFLILATRVEAQAEFVVPAVTIPARYVPGIEIPSVVIPGRDTPAGRIPEIRIPRTVIPGFWIPAVNTAAVGIPSNGFRDLNPATLPEQPADRSPRHGLPPRTGLDRGERDHWFAEYSGISSSTLLSFFAEADLDLNRSLSWEELQRFQIAVMELFTYSLNSTALPPDVFLQRLSGDCEDFAILTVNFVNYWGWAAVVGGLFDNVSGHAIALVESNAEAPTEFFTIELRPSRTRFGGSVAGGTYIPVDYHYVGGFSTAVRAGMRLTEFFHPKEIYGTVM